MASTTETGESRWSAECGVHQGAFQNLLTSVQTHCRPHTTTKVNRGQRNAKTISRKLHGSLFLMAPSPEVQENKLRRNTVHLGPHNSTHFLRFESKSLSLHRHFYLGFSLKDKAPGMTFLLVCKL